MAVPHHPSGPRAPIRTAPRSPRPSGSPSRQAACGRTCGRSASSGAGSSSGSRATGCARSRRWSSRCFFLFVLGTGLSSLASRGMPPGVDFKTFIYPRCPVDVRAVHGHFFLPFRRIYCVGPGVSGSLREDAGRARSGRSAIVIGKCLGGADGFPPSRESSFCAWPAWQAFPYNPILILTVIGELPAPVLHADRVSA